MNAFVYEIAHPTSDAERWNGGCGTSKVNSFKVWTTAQTNAVMQERRNTFLIYCILLDPTELVAFIGHHHKHNKGRKTYSFIRAFSNETDKRGVGVATRKPPRECCH